MNMAAIRGSDAHTIGEFRWKGTRGYPSYCRSAKEPRGRRILTATDGDGYEIELWDTGRLYTLRIYFWRCQQDASREGYTLDERVCGADWETVRDRAIARNVTEATIALVESEADEKNVRLR